MLVGERDDSAEVLARVLRSIEPPDLTPAAARCWIQLKQGKTPTLPAWATEFGLGIPFMAPTIASRLLDLMEAYDEYTQGQQQAAAAIEKVRAIRP